MNTNKIIYWVATAALFPILMGGIMYIVKNADIQAAFTSLGFPTWMIYPMAILKLLGIVAVVSRLVPVLTEWAYAGIFFNALFAGLAHFHAGDGSYFVPFGICAAVIVSRYYGNIVRPVKV